MKNDKQSTKIMVGLIVTAILLGFGIFNFYYNYKISKAPHIASIILGFIPALIAICNFIKLYSDITGNCVFLNLTLIIFSVFFITSSLITTKLLNKVTDVSDYNSYKKVLKYEESSGNKEFAHFPDLIPNGATEEEFKDWGNVGTDNSGMVLSYVMKNGIKEDDIKNKVADAKYKTVTKAGIDEVAEKLYVPDIVYEKLGLKNNEAKSDDFVYYVLDASIKEEGTKKNYSYGIIVDNTNQKVTYYEVKAK